MNVSARAESWDEKCRRADIPELEHGALGARWIPLTVPRHFEGGVCPRNPSVALRGNRRGIHRTKNVRWKTVPRFADSVRNDGGLVSALAAPATCKVFAKCRRADNIVFGIGRSVHERGWSAGACSRFYGEWIRAQKIEWGVGLRSQKRRRAAALQNCRRADILDLERGI